MTRDLFDQAPLSVSELNRKARALLEQGFAELWIEGEASNVARPSSGHIYFSLKDDSAQIRCAWFRPRQRGYTDALANGEQLAVLGRVSLYEARGEFQLIVEQIEPAGEGLLRQRFERLKKKLAAEGLFAAERKRPLPALPRQIGVITSPSGAAVRDILSVLERRFPAVPVILYPTAVQGAAAVGELTRALSVAGERDECDLLIIGRGGGSLEDLMAFNDESVARAIHASPIPTISAVGHEVDVTIADFVADARAPTPSGAAEIAVPEQRDWQRTVAQAERHLVQSLRRRLDDLSQTLDWLRRQLAAIGPMQKLKAQRVRWAALDRTLSGATRRHVAAARSRIETLDGRLQVHTPAHRVQRLRGALHSTHHRLELAGRSAISRQRARLELAQRALSAVSPMATLERGYAIVTEEKSGRLISEAAAAPAGTQICAQLARGDLVATVRKVRHGG